MSPEIKAWQNEWGINVNELSSCLHNERYDREEGFCCIFDFTPSGHILLTLTDTVPHYSDIHTLNDWFNLMHVATACRGLPPPLVGVLVPSPRDHLPSDTFRFLPCTLNLMLSPMATCEPDNRARSKCLAGMKWELHLLPNTVVHLESQTMQMVSFCFVFLIVQKILLFLAPQLWFTSLASTSHRALRMIDFFCSAAYRQALTLMRHWRWWGAALF